MNSIFLLWFIFFQSRIFAENDEIWKLIYNGNNKFAIQLCEQKKDVLINDSSFLTACIHSLDEKNISALFLNEICQKLSDSKNHLGNVCICKFERIEKKYDLALANCKKAIEINPLSEISYLEIAKVYSAKNNHLKAIDYLSKSIEISGENFFILYQLGIENEYLGKYSLALNYYKKAINFLTKNFPDSKFIPVLKEKIKQMEILSKKTSEKIAKAKFDKCLKEYNIEKNLEKKYEIGNKCLSFSVENINFLFEFASLCYEMGKNQEALNLYLKVLLRLKTSEKMLITYERIGEIYLKDGNKVMAEKYLKKAYESGSNNFDLIKKYANLLEENLDYSDAIKVYESLYKLKREQAILKKIEILKDKNLKPDEILIELKKRQVISEDKNYLLNEDKENFFRIREAERKGAVSYLKKKYPGYANLYIEILDGNNLKQLLTWKGYKVYLRDISQMAVRFFEKQSISLNEVFRLRDVYGRPIFTKQGELTDEGWDAYFKAVENNEKTWIRSYEEPLKKEEENPKEIEIANNKIKRLLEDGYVEIYGGEYEWLKTATDCPDDVLQSPPCNIQLVKVGKKIRYFICGVEGSFCAIHSDIPLKLFSYIENYRNGNTTVPKESKATSFFGMPAGPSRKFCYKNKIWNGEE